MKVLIAYASKYGCTEKCARMLKQKIHEEAELYNLKVGKTVDLKEYDKVIIGGSVYMGKIQKEVTEFCTKHINELKQKKIGLFICGMRDGDFAKEEINANFPKELLDRAASEFFGGEYVFGKMNMMERFIVKKIAKTDKDASNIIESNINRLAQAMNNA